MSRPGIHVFLLAPHKVRFFLFNLLVINPLLFETTDGDASINFNNNLQVFNNFQLISTPLTPFSTQKLLFTEKIKNRICVLIELDDIEIDDYGLRLNSGDDSAPAGLTKEIDIFDYIVCRNKADAELLQKRFGHKYISYLPDFLSIINI